MRKHMQHIILPAVVLAGIFFSCTGQKGKEAEKMSQDSMSLMTDKPSEFYTCPMHPSIVSDKPGACPICGMTLVKRARAQQSEEGDGASLRSINLSPSQRVIANVSTTTVGRADLNKEVSAVGVVDFAEPLQTKVSARFNGRIERLYVNFTGAHVRKGDPLFELHSPDLISAEEELILAVNAARPDSSGDNHQQELLEASRERLHIHFGMTHEQIVALESDQTARETMTFRSPISGTVISKDIQEGQYVSEGMLLYQLADLSRVWVYLDVYERDVAFVKLGHPVKITTESFSNRVFSGKVTFIDPVINPETRTVRVRTELANPTGELKPQMNVSAQIHVPSRNTLTIPATAIMYTGKKTIAWVEMKPNSFEPRDVSLGINSGASIEILSGLREGEQVVTSGGFMIESESQLQQPAAGASGGHQHGTSAAVKPQDVTGHTAQPSSNVVQIMVDGGYTPNVIHAKSGEPITLVFERMEDVKCTEEVVFKDFNIRKKLPLNETVRITLTPSKPGEYVFTCGENMVTGKLVVH